VPAKTASDAGDAAARPTPGRPQAESPGRANGSGLAGLGRRLLTLREGSVILITLFVAAYFSVTTDAFLTWENFKTLLPYFAPFAILAAGEVFLMINGEIDLSIGAVYLFAPFIFYEFDTVTGLPLMPALLLALFMCVLVGIVNGVFTAVVGINSFITTLGMLLGLQGFTLIISDAQPVQTPGTDVLGEASTFSNVFGGSTYSELIWALVIVIVLQLVLSYTRWGIYTVAVGSNRIAAAEAGIRVRLVIIRNFVLCAVCAGLVGVLEAVRTTSVQPDPSGANDVLFGGIAAAVIGGTLLAGGSGTVVGALIGALLLGVLNDGLIIEGVNADYLSFYLGLAIIIAMAANTYIGRVRRGEVGA
jgi:simple sugar transport system permease protein